MENLTETNLSEELVQQLKASLRGELLRPGDEGYNPARTLWNAMIDRKPALIVRASGVADVIKAVNFARENSLLLSVRSGGHNVTGNAAVDNGLMLDLSKMRSVRVDPLARTAIAQAGCTWGDVDHETQAFGLAVTGGMVSHTGIGGLSLGGGFGLLARKYGMVVDNILSVDIVTADGQYLHASATENEDLFWGVRGGGGNFGVVTAFEYRLHPVGPIITGGMALYPLSQGKELLAFFREYVENAPDDLTMVAAILTAPPAPFVPPDLQGTTMVAIIMCHCGSLEEGAQAAAKLRSFTKPALDMLGPIPYAIQQTLIDEANAFGFQQYNKGEHIKELSDEVIEVLLSQARTISSPLTSLIIFPYFGAPTRVDSSATAYSHRHPCYLLDSLTAWTDTSENERHFAWTRNFHASIRPFSNNEIYVNLLVNEGEERIKQAYPASTYERLVALKNKYDPTNLFRLNQNIKPTV
jgi:FAD/FMN-containing dehydrogenase